MSGRRVCVVGGGPAGLSAAIHAARRGADVTLREKNDRCGAKLLATGGGRCNVTNERPLAEWPELFGKRGRFILPALERLDGKAIRDWFARMGQPLRCTDGFHLFPESNSARMIRDALLKEAARNGVKVETVSRAKGIEPEGAGKLWFIGDSERTAFDSIVLACGGNSYPTTGSTWDGVRMAAALGHRTAAPVPGLVGLRVSNLSPELAGLVLPDAAVSCSVKGQGVLWGRGELLMTHEGISGPAVLDMSASVLQAMAKSGGVDVAIRWAARMGTSDWITALDWWRKEKGGASLVSLLRRFLPVKLARWLCAGAGLPELTNAGSLSGAAREKLVYDLSAFPARIYDGEGWDRAMITRGGVDVREVDPGTLESRLAPGVHFAGEMLDVDGPCGGYNLHWAFASGALAGESAAGM